MNKKLENIKTDLIRKDSEREVIIRKSNSEVKKLRDKIADLNSQLDEAEDLEAYEKIKADIKDANSTMDFLEKKAAKSKDPVINDPDYKKIISEVNSEVERLKALHSPMIQKKLLELVELLNKYADEAEEVESIRDIAYKLHDASTFKTESHYRTASDISEYNIDPYEWQPSIIRAYWQHRYLILETIKKPESIIKNIGASPESKRIAKAYLNDRR